MNALELTPQQAEERREAGLPPGTWSLPEAEPVVHDLGPLFGGTP